MVGRLSLLASVFLLALLFVLTVLTQLKVVSAFDSIPENSHNGKLGQAVNCQDSALALEPTDSDYCFIKGLVNSQTNLVQSREYECFTTLYKNSLAATAFIHEGDFELAEGIFDFFQNQLTATVPISGFVKNWNPCSGDPLTQEYWEGDNAFLLLALNYYADKAGTYGKYVDLVYALRDSLINRSNSCDQIVAEGVANMYAALVPFSDDHGIWMALSKLSQCYFESVNYSTVTDHTVRGALVFGDLSGFEHLNNFRRTDFWEYDESISVTGYAGSAPPNFINLEITAQVLLANRLWPYSTNPTTNQLRANLEQLRLSSQQNPNWTGLPYVVTHPDAGGFDGDYSTPIVDSTAYLLYDDWQLNPFAPGRDQAGCTQDKFVSLILGEQSEGFPRVFRAGQDPLDPSFPQEINSSSHKRIVIEFATEQWLAMPITLTVDTVDRDVSFKMRVHLDNNDHCLNGCEIRTLFEGAEEKGSVFLDNTCHTFLPVMENSGGLRVAKQAIQLEQIGSASHQSDEHVYQLILDGEEGWGVFDWLQLETPNEVLWVIGIDDDKCSEFDNVGFVFQCEQTD